MAFHIRRAVPSDVPEITLIVKEAYKHYVQRMGKPPAPMLEDYTEIVARKYVWVIEGKESDLVGVLVLVPEKDYLLIENIAIKPGNQGKGFGRRLMEFADSEALRMGYESVRLYTNAKMVENQSFYEYLGWKKIDRVMELGYDRIYMEKRLSHTNAAD